MKVALAEHLETLSREYLASQGGVIDGDRDRGVFSIVMHQGVRKRDIDLSAEQEQAKFRERMAFAQFYKENLPLRERESCRFQHIASFSGVIRDNPNDGMVRGLVDGDRTEFNMSVIEVLCEIEHLPDFVREEHTKLDRGGWTVPLCRIERDRCFSHGVAFRVELRFAWAPERARIYSTVS